MRLSLYIQIKIDFYPRTEMNIRTNKIFKRDKKSIKNYFKIPMQIKGISIMHFSMILNPQILQFKKTIKQPDR